MSPNATDPVCARRARRTGGILAVMIAVERHLLELGGLASVAQLARLGHDPEMLRVWAASGRIVRVRRGWYASRGIRVPVDGAARRRLGRPRALVDAVEYRLLAERLG
jgi:hypothetical protein